MDSPVEQFTHGGYTVSLYHDTDADSPDSWDSNGVLIVTTRNRHFDVTPKDWRGVDLKQILERAQTRARVFVHAGARWHVRPLYAYIHSGVALSLGRGGQFSDPWDSGLIGAVLIRTGVVGRGRPKRNGPGRGHGNLSRVDMCALGHVETWNQYLSGDVYGYQITTPAGECVDSCWGFYGFDYAKSEALDMAKWYAEKHPLDDDETQTDDDDDTTNQQTETETTNENL